VCPVSGKFEICFCYFRIVFCPMKSMFLERKCIEVRKRLCGMSAMCLGVCIFAV
jgi:hypothetical protein